MAKTKVLYGCTECGMQHSKWNGQCSACGTWNSLLEEISVSTKTKNLFTGYAGAPEQQSQVTLLSEVGVAHDIRSTTGLSELDRVLGGGLVQGAVVLIGGDPGIGKSTLLLQALCLMSQQQKSLYVTGEESLQQVAMRASRLGLPNQELLLLPETQVERMLLHAEREKPQVMVIDSIQTIYTELLASAPGSVGQVRESAAQLVRFAKQTGTSLFIVGHVTKDGTLAGPRVLEHMVDTVLYFEGEKDNRYRVVRAIKNRFGAVNELGIFAMTDKGLKTVSNPSAIFLSRNPKPVPGSCVLVSWEGSRPLLVEVQALVDDSYIANPRRVTVGLDHQRLSMLLAVLHRHGDVATHNQDVFVNVVGGVKVTETAADLAILLAMFSSLRNRPLEQQLVVFGEVGLAGEVRPVQSGHDRLHEAAKHGFTKAIVPQGNAPKKPIAGMEIIAVEHIQQALQQL